MKAKSLGWLSLITLLVTTLWLIFLIWSLFSAGPLETFEQVLAHAGKKNGLFRPTYINAGVLTIAALALMGGLYTYIMPMIPGWSIVGLLFLPVYGTLNLIVYFSQVTLVPALLQASSDPVTADTALLLLQETLQLYSGSTLGFLNVLAYAVLGIPSIIFGWALTQDKNHLIRISGWFLMANGITCIAGLIGTTNSIDFLSLGTVLGGALFWISLFPMTIGFLINHDG